MRPTKGLTRSHLKNRILVQSQGGARFQPAGILEYVEDLKPGPNAEIGPKDIFEIASNFSLLTRCAGTIKIKTMIIDFKAGRTLDLLHHRIDLDTFVINYFLALRADNMGVWIRLFTVIAVKINELLLGFV